jgi:peptidoglycan/xylan/chitin deacetylase (PgdA/CDA1 family)
MSATANPMSDRSISRSLPGGRKLAGAPTAPPGCTDWSVQMEVLVISADGSEPTLSAIKDALGYHTIPFTTWIATQNQGLLTPDRLSTGCNGNYQGVVLTTGSLAYSPDGGITWQSALSSTEWANLRTYEADFHVREISWYVYPSADQGLNPPSSGVDTTVNPINGWLTTAGQTVFPYVNASNPITITNAWAYKATPADPNVTPLLVDDTNDALVSSRLTSDGRETLALTFDSNQWLIHDLVLAHGLVEWVTNGIYLGEFRAYSEPQIDDLLIDDDIYGGGTYRMTDVDFNAARSWQAEQKLSVGPDFWLTWAFNGFGGSDTDPLTLAASRFNAEFHWINHTWDHTTFDNISEQNAYDEITNNDAFASRQGYQNYSTMSLVTPEISGLSNSDAMAGAWAAGVRYVVSDTSKPGGDNPAPNIGNYNAYQTQLLQIPRKPTNLFYNVSTPSEWTAEYNSIYHSYWGRDLTYQEILDNQSHDLLVYLLQGNIDPTMYHQSNVRAYDGTHSLLSDLLDAAFQKFRTYSTLPVVSPAQHVAGARIANTMARNQAGVSASLFPGVSVSFTSPVTVDFAVSGLCTTGCENYAGKCISSVHVDAGQTVTFPLN